MDCSQDGDVIEDNVKVTDRAEGVAHTRVD